MSNTTKKNCKSKNNCKSTKNNKSDKNSKSAKKIKNLKGGNNNIEMFTSDSINNKKSIGLVRGMAMTKVSSFKSFLSGISSLLGDTDEKFSGIHDSIMNTQNKALEEKLWR